MTEMRVTPVRTRTSFSGRSRSGARRRYADIPSVVRIQSGMIS